MGQDGIDEVKARVRRGGILKRYEVISFSGRRELAYYNERPKHFKKGKVSGIRLRRPLDLTFSREQLLYGFQRRLRRLLGNIMTHAGQHISSVETAEKRHILILQRRWAYAIVDTAQ